MITLIGKLKTHFEKHFSELHKTTVNEALTVDNGVEWVENNLILFLESKGIDFFKKVEKIYDKNRTSLKFDKMANKAFKKCMKKYNEMFGQSK